MSDVPRKVWRLPMGRHRGYSLAVLAYLWSFVVVARKRSGGPHWVFFTLKRLAEDLDVGERQVSQGLTGLAEAGLVQGKWLEGQYGYWLSTPAGLEDPQQAPDRASDDPAVGDRQGGERRVAELEMGARLGGDRRSHQGGIVDRAGRDRRSHQGGIVDRTLGDRRSETGRSSIEFWGLKEEQLATQLATPIKTAQLASVGDALPERARELLAEAATRFAPVGPDGQLLVGPHQAQAVDLLGQLLDVPEQGEPRPAALADRATWVRQVVLAYATLCATDVGGEGRWWTPLMFAQAPIGPGKPGVLRKPPWLVVVGKVLEFETREAERLAGERHAAQRAADAAAHEAARQEADRRDAAARASWSPLRIAEALSASSAPHAMAVRQFVAQGSVKAPPGGLSREEIIERRVRITDQIRVAQDAGEHQLVTELSQARLELSRALLALDSQPFGGQTPAN